MRKHDECDEVSPFGFKKKRSLQKTAARQRARTPSLGRGWMGRLSTAYWPNGRGRNAAIPFARALSEGACDPKRRTAQKRIKMYKTNKKAAQKRCIKLRNSTPHGNSTIKKEKIANLRRARRIISHAPEIQGLTKKINNR